MSVATMPYFRDGAIRRISSKYGIRIIFSLLKIDIETLMNFLNFLGVEERPNHKHKIW